jgi:predicted GTPase
MNDKIRELLKNAEKSDAIAINKWRIENREQLRKERKEKLKELMERDAAEAAMDEYNRMEEESEMDN